MELFLLFFWLEPKEPKIQGHPPAGGPPFVRPAHLDSDRLTFYKFRTEG